MTEKPLSRGTLDQIRNRFENYEKYLPVERKSVVDCAYEGIRRDYQLLFGHIAALAARVKELETINAMQGQPVVEGETLTRVKITLENEEQS